MKIIVDACGGDHAPQEIVRGCVEAVRELGVSVILVGRGEQILQVLNDDGHHELPRGMEIMHASQVVGMDDNAANTIKEKPDSSLCVGLRLLSEGKGDAFVSAGSTGALLSAGTFIVKRVKGIRRAALSPVIPTAKGNALLIDSGANLECTPEYFLQFGYMGTYYTRHMLKIDNPRVGLLNIGAEETKGPPSHREAYQLLCAAREAGKLNFVGNIEARDAVTGEADVIVADGFSGNILLKTMEGTGAFFAGQLKEMFYANLLTKIAGLLVKPGITAFKKKMDYAETGGAVLLGLSKPVIKAHGSSKARAVKSAIRQAALCAETGLISEITGNIALMKTGDA